MFAAVESSVVTEGVAVWAGGCWSSDSRTDFPVCLAGRVVAGREVALFQWFAGIRAGWVGAAEVAIGCLEGSSDRTGV